MCRESALLESDPIERVSGLQREAPCWTRPALTHGQCRLVPIVKGPSIKTDGAGRPSLRTEGVAGICVREVIVADGQDDARDNGERAWQELVTAGDAHPKLIAVLEIGARFAGPIARFHVAGSVLDVRNRS